MEQAKAFMAKHTAASEGNIDAEVGGILMVQSYNTARPSRHYLLLSLSLHIPGLLFSPLDAAMIILGEALLHVARSGCGVQSGGARNLAPSEAV